MYPGPVLGVGVVLTDPDREEIKSLAALKLCAPHDDLAACVTHNTHIGLIFRDCD